MSLREMPCVTVCQQVPSCRTRCILGALARASLPASAHVETQELNSSFRPCQSFPVLRLEFPHVKNSTPHFTHTPSFEVPGLQIPPGVAGLELCYGLILLRLFS